MIVASAVVLAAAGACWMVRIVQGPSLADRIVALDGLVVTIVCAIVLRSIAIDRDWFLDVALVVAFVGFVGTTAGARFVERKGA
jgi:multicomponent Na+:H+ antiporter subunit F